MMLNARRWMRPVMAALLLSVSVLALALPTPKDIETAVREGHMAQAETMLREVIQEKPQSAKAHYELGQVLARQARYPEALGELKQAKTIDPSLKFAGSDAQFNAVFDKVSAAATPAVTHSTATATPQVAPAAPAAAGSSPLSYIWIAIALVVVVAWLARRLVANNPPAGHTVAAPMPPAMPPQPARGFGAQFTPNPPGYAPSGYGPQGYPAPAPSGGSTMAGAVVGGLAGVAAGYALSKALEGDHHSSAAASAADNSGGYVPFDAPARPDLGSFDAGSGSGWDDSGSDAGGDDSW